MPCGLLYLTRAGDGELGFVPRTAVLILTWFRPQGTSGVGSVRRRGGARAEEPCGADPLSLQRPGPPRTRGAARAPEMSVPASDSPAPRTALTGPASCPVAPCLLQPQDVNADVPLFCHQHFLLIFTFLKKAERKPFQPNFPPFPRPDRSSLSYINPQRGSPAGIGLGCWTGYFQPHKTL